MRTKNGHFYQDNGQRIIHLSKTIYIDGDLKSETFASTKVVFRVLWYKEKLKMITLITDLT